MNIYQTCENCGMRFISVFKGKRYCDDKSCLRERQEKLRLAKIERNNINWKANK